MEKPEQQEQTDSRRRLHWQTEGGSPSQLAV
jgi:hypothetical protein